MVVDDDPIMRLLVGELLVRAGHRVLRAASAADALAALEAESPALFVLDYRMPDIDGAELARRLRATPRFASAPILMLTAADSASDVEVVLAAGADSYMGKPIAAPSLLERVGALLGLGRLRAPPEGGGQP